MSKKKECPDCGGTGVSFSAPYIREECERCTKGPTMSDEAKDNYITISKAEWQQYRELTTALAAAKAECERLKLQIADADLLLGDGWEQVIEIANGSLGVSGALSVQCTKLSGDIAELKDELAALRIVAAAR